MAAKGGHIDFMFLDPPYPAAGSATDYFDGTEKIPEAVKRGTGHGFLGMAGELQSRRLCE